MFSVISWWLAVQFCGLIALPLTWRVFARLPGRAYPLAKVLGLLLVTYTLWLGATFRLLPNTAGGIVVSAAVVAAVSGWLGRAGLRRGDDGRRPIVSWLSGNRGLILATEALFLLVLAGWSRFRAYNPEIAGTEKPMEFAFINGVLGSRFFPPQDPWLSGYGISYYYFGYVMLAALVRITGVLPEVGFNLGVAMWYALVMTSAFGVAYTLVALSRPSPQAGVHGDAGPPDGQPVVVEAGRPGRTAIGWGLGGAVLLGVMANLEGIIDSAYHRGLLPLQVVQWFNIKGLTDSPPTGEWTGGFWWWWRASRVIHDQSLPVDGVRSSVEVIDEFPFFSFLLGDLHPHVLALPFVLLAIMASLNLLINALGLASVRLADDEGRLSHLARVIARLGHATGLHPLDAGDAVAPAHGAIASNLRHASAAVPGISLYAIVLGSLAFLNTWDFPVYVGLAALAYGGGLVLVRGLNWRSVGEAVLAFVLLGVLSYLAYLPFHVGLRSQLGGILPNLLFPTQLRQYFLMFGPFLVVATGFLLLQGIALRPRAVAGAMLRVLPWTLLVPLALLGSIVGVVALAPQGRAFVQELLQRPEIAANVSGPGIGALLELVARVRIDAPWTYLVLAVLLAAVAGTAWTLLRYPGTAGEAPASEVPWAGRVPAAADFFALCLVFVALALTFVPEFLYLRDLFGSRMNTVFKFYYQAWVLLALASAFGLSRLAARTTPIGLKAPVLALAGLLILAGLWYPLAATPSKADGFEPQATPEGLVLKPTLDGLAYLRRDRPADVKAIEWLRANVPGDAVVVEASGGSYSPEGAGRVSMSTGNPTLLGWDFHERQWRGNEGYDALAAMRPGALEQIYRIAQPIELGGILDVWGVDYVYIGALERSKYGVSDVALERLDAALKRVYDVDGVRIYAR